MRTSEECPKLHYGLGFGQRRRQTIAMRDSSSARECVLPLDFLKKANHYDYFDCYTLGNAKPVVGTSEVVAESDYDVIKMATILNFNTNLLCFIISIIVGRFQIFR